MAKAKKPIQATKKTTPGGRAPFTSAASPVTIKVPTFGTITKPANSSGSPDERQERNDAARDAAALRSTFFMPYNVGGYVNPNADLGMSDILNARSGGIQPTIATEFNPSEFYQTSGLGGGSGGGESMSVPQVAPELAPITSIKWKQGTFNLQDAKSPTWWKSLIPENAADMERPDVAYVAMLNTMIPYMSPEDQKRAAGLIYETVGGDQFGHYEQSQIQVPISKETAGLTSQTGLPVIDTQYYQSSSRASGAVDALSQLREMTVGGNREKIGGTGIGYRFLQDLLQQIQSFGGKPGEGQTRSQMLAMQGALDPIMAQAGTSEIGPVGAIAQMLSQPFFSQSNLYPYSKSNGRVFFGQPNPVLFG